MTALGTTALAQSATAERRYDVTAARVIQTDRFFARQILVNNLMPRWVYIRLGGTDVPTAANCDLAVAPFIEQTTPITATNLISVGLGPVIQTLGQQVQANKAIITLYDEPQPGSVGSIDLNPSRLGNVDQVNFVVNTTRTVAFPVTTLHVANYSTSWVWIRIGSLVIPTAATADHVLPPMSEKSFTCLPNTQFAFGLSAALVTTGQQIPGGTRITVTFFEYPTPVSIGTADLNPSKLGLVNQQKFTAASSYTIGFVVTTVHVQNYTRAWLYVRFNSLVIPTAATADVQVPPMSEKSLTTLPTTQFAFGFSAVLVTAGQQLPTGVEQVIATFFEYPTPVSIGTASLNPASMGQSVSTGRTASGPIDPAFPATQVNVSNYLQNWIYATYGQANRLLNPDLETWAAGLPVSWGPVVGTGSVVQAAAYRGTFGALITHGLVGSNDYILQGVGVTPGETLACSFWCTGDGVNNLRYWIWDLTHGAYIVAPAGTGIVGADYAPFRFTFVIPAGCVDIVVNVGYDAGQPAGAFGRVDTLTLQVNTTAANAQIAVPPMSEKSISLPPATHLDVVVGTQTIMVATGVPVTQAIFTLYEYYTPVNLGVSPLSPGGFRFRQIIGINQPLTIASTFDFDLSNFTKARYSMELTNKGVANMAVQARIVDWSLGVNTFAKSALLNQLGSKCTVDFDASRSIQIGYVTTPGVFGFNLSHMIEAY